MASVEGSLHGVSDAADESLHQESANILTIDTSGQADALEKENIELRSSVDALKDQVERLSSQLKESTDRLQKDKTHAQEDLQKKTAIIDKMRVKLNRYEFAIKEAILFLSKPMEGYEAWLNSPSNMNGSQAMLAAAVAGAIHATQSHAPPSPSPSMQDGRSRSPSAAPKPSAWLSPLSKDARSSSQMLLPAASTHGSSTPSGDAKPGGATNLEIQCLECMRLALNYLKNAQASVLAMGKDGSELPTNLGPPPRLIAEGSRILSESVLEVDEADPSDEKKVRASLTVALNDLEKKIAGNEKKGVSTKSSSPGSPAPSPLSVTAGSQTSQTSLLPSKELPVHTRAKSPQRSNLSMEWSATAVLTNQALIHAAEALPEEEDGDITATKTSSYSATINKKCTNCRELRLSNEHHVDTINKLRENVTTLANELEEERATIARIQLSKDILDQELEELTAQLFDQANRMVIDEARMREELENSNRDLRGELKELLQKTEGREEELRELRRNLRALEAAKNRSANSASPYSSINNLSTSPKDSTQNLNAPLMIPKGSASHHFYALTSLSPPRNSLTTTFPVDGQLLSEFQDHIKHIMLSSSLPPQQATQSTFSTPFMKRCLAEDVEPCLFYTYTAYINTSTLFGNITPSLEMDKTKCFTCTISRDCDFRLRLSAPTSPTDIHPLCRFCRDRVSAVHDFFVFMGHLRQGLIGPGKQGATILGMFRHAVWLRRRMAVGRVGSCALFEGDTLAAVDRRGEGEWERGVRIVN
ncbi:hypothetical protein BC829DRAFT_441706 [Chytridium lagenaria]|nr:hypothetical protein BC829DRAFT_441706 [Chytridium lagenaria]